MENSSWQLVALISAVAAIFISKIIQIRRRPQRNLPPGPKPWPIIGNLNLLGPIPHQSLHHLSQKYGKLMLLKFGKFPVLVASSPKMAEQFLKVHDAVFASRPAFTAGKYISYDYSDIAFTPYGPYWREARKIFMTQILSSKKLEDFDHIRSEERRGFLSRLRSLSGKPVVLRDHISRYTLSAISRMVVTDKYFSETAEESSSSLNVNSTVDLREMINEWFRLSGAFNIGDWIPWIAFLDLQGYVKDMKALRKKTDKFYDYVIETHLARRGEEEEGKRDAAKKDFVDILLLIAEDTNAKVELTRDRVKALTMSLLIGGTDTSTTTIEWAMYEMLRQPRIIEKAKEELDRVIGRNRWVDETDFARLPYIEAIITETFRIHPLGTLIPHCAIEDCNVAGYDIAKGTMVFINTWSIGRDPELWDEPEKFLPERFVGKEIDWMGSNFSLFPFGSGRRTCPGYNLGLKIVRTTLANLLHGFELKLEEGMRAEDISMEEKFGLSTIPKHPLSIVMKPTLPDHLYSINSDC